VHNDIDLLLLEPSGAVKASSQSAVSVFERALVTNTLAAGQWKLRIHGFKVPIGGQTVSWAAHVY